MLTRMLVALFVALAPLAFADTASDIAGDSCVYDCCATYGSIPGVMLTRGTETCLAHPDSCVIIYNGATKGTDNVACVTSTETGRSNPKAFSAVGIFTCLREKCQAVWVPSSPSPFNVGPEEEKPEPERPKSVCDDVACPRECRYEGGLPMLYYDGRCVEDNKTAKGYYCGYVKGQCVWQCNSDGTNCEDTDPLSVSIDEPVDGTTYDPGNEGKNVISVSGTVSSSSEHNVARVLVSASLLSPAEAQYDAAIGKFRLDGVMLQAGGPTYITATAYDSAGRRLGTRSATVYSYPKLMRLGFTKGYTTLLRNGQVIGSDWAGGIGDYNAKEGDEFQVTGGGTVTATYSDGTIVILKAPFTVRIYENAIELKKGAVEVDVKRDYRVLGRLGYHIVKGTRFKVIAPESSGEPEALIVLQGTVLSGNALAPESAAAVSAGQRLYVYGSVAPGQASVGTANAAEMLSFSQGGDVTRPETTATSPTSGGGCGSAAILLALGFAAFAARR